MTTSVRPEIVGFIPDPILKPVAVQRQLGGRGQCHRDKNAPGHPNALAVRTHLGQNRMPHGAPGIAVSRFFINQGFTLVRHFHVLASC